MGDGLVGCAYGVGSFSGGSALMQLLDLFQPLYAGSFAISILPIRFTLLQDLHS